MFSPAASVATADQSLVYLIVDAHKNSSFQTEYIVSNLAGGELSVKLKRSQNKNGIEFRVLRKLLGKAEK
jgi:hypothetical protein